MKTSSPPWKSKNCSECGASFACGATEKGQDCWCNGLLAIMPLDFSQDCRCPECLQKVIKEKIDKISKTVPPENADDSIAKK